MNFQREEELTKTYKKNKVDCIVDDSEYFESNFMENHYQHRDQISNTPNSYICTNSEASTPFDNIEIFENKPVHKLKSRFERMICNRLNKQDKS